VFPRRRVADPAAMVSELESMGTKLMVSVWPSVSPLSANYQPMAERGLLVSNEQGPELLTTWPERDVNAFIGAAFYDSTNADARDYIWARSRRTITTSGAVFWLDACEPEMKPLAPRALGSRPGRGSRLPTCTPESMSAPSTRLGRLRRGGSTGAVPVRLVRQPALRRGRLVG